MAAMGNMSGKTRGKQVLRYSPESLGKITLVQTPTKPSLGGHFGAFRNTSPLKISPQTQDCLHIQHVSMPKKSFIFRGLPILYRFSVCCLDFREGYSSEAWSSRSFPQEVSITASCSSFFFCSESFST